MDFKVNIGEPKTAKTHKKEISGDEADVFLSKKIGDKIDGGKVGFPGYEFEITGGSDSSGFPMRKDVTVGVRKKILIANGVGTNHKRKGMRIRKTVASNIVHAKTAQINLKVLKAGKEPLTPVEAAPTEEAKTE